MTTLTLEKIMANFNNLKGNKTIFSLVNFQFELEGIGDHHIMCKANGDGALYYIYDTQEKEQVIVRAIDDEAEQTFPNHFTTVTMIVDPDNLTNLERDEIVDPDNLTNLEREIGEKVTALEDVLTKNLCESE
uniref:Uncharacterized protein n=1 Tax=viral metagenome TaxID=1070528 RepID=A0A6C0I368_9ZZZZ